MYVFFLTWVNCDAGGDAGKQYRGPDWSCTVMGLRCMDVPNGREMANSSWRPVCVVEGPEELTTWRYVLEPIVDWFVQHDPSAGKTSFVFLLVIHMRSLHRRRWCLRGDKFHMHYLLCQFWTAVAVRSLAFLFPSNL